MCGGHIEATVEGGTWGACGEMRTGSKSRGYRRKVSESVFTGRCQRTEAQNQTQTQKASVQNAPASPNSYTHEEN